MALHHFGPGDKVHLPSVASRKTKTAALVKTDAFEAMQLILRSGDVIADHSVPGFVTIVCLEGSVTLYGAKQVRLSAGEWMYLDRGEKHSVSAHEDSSLLVTIMFEKLVAGLARSS